MAVKLGGINPEVQGAASQLAALLSALRCVVEGCGNIMNDRDALLSVIEAAKEKADLVALAICD